MTIESMLLLVAVFVAAIFDYKFRKVPNIIVFPATLAGMTIAYFNGGLTGLTTSMIGFASGIALLAFPYIVGGMGAGDVKLLGAIGAIKGPWFVLVTFLATAIIGGIMSVWKMAFIIKGSDMKILGKSVRTFYYTGTLSAIEIPEYARKESLPYAVAISAGAIVALILEMR